MEISLNGQSAFLVKTDSGSVICDPTNEAEATFVPQSPADETEITAILRSKPARSSFGARLRFGGSDTVFHDVLSHPGEYEIGDLALRGVAMPVAADSKKTTTSFRIDAEGLAVYMLGRPRQTPDNQTVRIIGHVDVLLLDAARLQMDLKELSSLISGLDPAHVIVNGLDGETGEAGPTLKSLLGETGGGGSHEPQLRVNISRNTLPSDRQLTVLRPRA